MPTIEVEFECSWFTPGARWVHGGEYHAVLATIEYPDSLGIDEDDINEDILDMLVEYATDEVEGCRFVNEEQS